MVIKTKVKTPRDAVKKAIEDLSKANKAFAEELKKLK